MFDCGGDDDNVVVAGETERVVGAFTTIESTVVVDAFEVCNEGAADPVLRILAGSLGRGATVLDDDGTLLTLLMLIRAASWWSDGGLTAAGFDDEDEVVVDDWDVAEEIGRAHV